MLAAIAQARDPLPNAARLLTSFGPEMWFATSGSNAPLESKPDLLELQFLP